MATPPESEPEPSYGSEEVDDALYLSESSVSGGDGPYEPDDESEECAGLSDAVDEEDELDSIVSPHRTCPCLIGTYGPSIFFFWAQSNASAVHPVSCLLHRVQAICLSAAC